MYFWASLTLFSIFTTFVILPVREISHIKTEFLGIALFVLLEIIEAAIAKSIPGSYIFNHLTIFI